MKELIHKTNKQIQIELKVKTCPRKGTEMDYTYESERDVY